MVRDGTNCCFAWERISFRYYSVLSLPRFVSFEGKVSMGICLWWGRRRGACCRQRNSCTSALTTDHQPCVSLIVMASESDISIFHFFASCGQRRRARLTLWGVELLTGTANSIDACGVLCACYGHFRGNEVDWCVTKYSEYEEGCKGRFKRSGGNLDFGLQGGKKSFRKLGNDWSQKVKIWNESLPSFGKTKWKLRN